MKTRKGYLPQDSIYPLEGLDTFDPSVQLANNRSPNCLNMELVKGEVEKRKGYNYLGGSITDPVIGLVEFQSFSGTKTLLAFTTKKQYKYDSGSNSWTNITYQSAGVDVNWTGSESDTFDYVIASGKTSGGTYTTWIIATNGKDQPRYWDGAASKFALFSPSGISGFVTCKALASFNDHLILANVTTASAQPTTIYWSETQELTKFADVANNTGIAILPDIQGSIQRLLQLGDRMMIYSDNAIHSMVYVAGLIIFTFEKILQETRLVSSRSVVNIGPFHLFLSQENVIYFDGTKLWGQIGNRVYRSYRDEFFATNRYMAFAFHDVAKLHVYFAYPVAGSTSQIYKTEYTLTNLADSHWTRFKYTDRPTCMGFYSRDTNLTCDSPFLTGVKCSGLDLICSQGSVKGGFPVRVFGTPAGRICLCDDSIPNDAGTAPDAYWDTKDFIVPAEYQSSLARWIELEADMKGFEVDVYSSIDQGRTYQLVQTLNLTNEWTWYTIPIDVMSKTLRIRLRNQCPSSSFGFRDIRLWMRAGGPTQSLSV